MLKNFARSFSSGFTKFFTIDRVMILVVFLILAIGLYSYSGSKSLRMDGMTNGSIPSTSGPVTSGPVTSGPSTSGPSTSGPSTSGPVTSGPVMSTLNMNTVPAAQASSGYTAQSVTAPQDLLPKDQNSQWAALNPVAQGNIAAPDLLQAGYHIGLDTIGQTLRNANLQERSDPVIPKSNIGPWNQSTIEPDLGRVPLEVGCGAK